MKPAKIRDSNLELLRILAMFAILFYHFYTQTAIFKSPVATFPHWFAMFFGSFGRSAVNLFVVIGAWHLIDLPFRSIRVLRLYLTCLFYTVSVTALVLWSSPGLPEEMYKALLRAMMPFTASPLWFITDYLFLLLLAPFLNILIKHLDREKFRTLALLLLTIFTLIPTVANLIPGMNVQKFYIVKSDMGWLAALYLLTGYVKTYGLPYLLSPRHAGKWLLGVILFAAAAGAADCFAAPKLPSAFLAQKFHAFLEFLWTDLGSPFAVLCTLSAFTYFRGKSFSNSWINQIAGGLLGVYILHQIPVFIPKLWGMFRVPEWVDSVWFPLWEILTVVTVFCACRLIDAFRETLFRPLFRMKMIQRLTTRCDAWFNGSEFTR